MGGAVTASDMMVLLAKRFGAPAWALIPQVREATGAYSTRTADAIAMSLWPSRGLEVHGFEVKVSRSDWQRELKQPWKAEAIQRYCDRWWIVTPSTGIVAAGELPANWGLLVKQGRRLVAAKEAPKLGEPAPLDRPFIASVLRRMATTIAPKLDVESIEEAYERGKSDAASTHRSDEWELRQLRTAVASFEEASGVKISSGWNQGRVGAAVKVVLDGHLDHHRLNMQRTAESLEQAAAALRRGLSDEESDQLDVEAMLRVVGGTRS